MNEPINTLDEIAAVIAEGAGALEADSEVTLPLDANRALHLLRNPWRPGWVLSASVERPDAPGPALYALRENLLRLAADTRWTSGLAGGIDPQGRPRVYASLEAPGDTSAVEALASALLAPLAAPSADGADRAEPPPAAPMNSWHRV